MFKAGDLVERADGGTFSNGQKIVTVERVECDKTIWLKETKSNAPSSYLKLVKRIDKDVNDAIEILEIKLLNLKSEVNRVQTAIAALKAI